jgi:hypothetical protein
MKITPKNSEINQILETFDRILNTESFINESGTFSAPLKGDVYVTSPFGQNRKYEVHPGVDIRAKSGTEILSPADGVVVLSDPDNNPKCGGTIDVQFTDGFWGRFCHVKALYKKKGDPVKQGDILGLSGGYINDPGHGNSKDAHIHFTLKKDGNLVDPMDYINKAKITTGGDVTTLVGSSTAGGTSSNLSGKGLTGNTLNKLAYYLKQLEAKSKYFDYEVLPPHDESGLGLFEGKVFGNFGRSIKNIGKEISIPKSDNRNIKSPITGYVISNFNSGNDILTIEFDIEGIKHYLEFSNIINIGPSVGDKVKEGDFLGEAKDDVKVSLYDDKNTKINLNPDMETTKKQTSKYSILPLGSYGSKNDDDEKNKKKTEKKVKKIEKQSHKKIKEPKHIPSKRKKSLFPDVKGERPSRYFNQSAANMFGLPKDILNATFNALTNKKVNEEIERIKKLL